MPRRPRVAPRAGASLPFGAGRVVGWAAIGALAVETSVDDPDIELLQFPYSHYNEKARWALDLKRVPHRRRNLLPGPHMLTIRRLTGQSQVPVVCFGERPVHGSARILDELERLFPEPPLYPADPALRKRALEIQTWFDAGIGPPVRRAVFATLLGEPGYVCAMFTSGRSGPVRAGYRATFPLVKGAMKKSMGITDASIAAALAATRQALDFVAREAGPEGQLVGDRFTVADLTAAALLAPCANPPNSAMARPEPMPPALAEWQRRWAEHPGTAWVLDQYRRHRPAC
jgi:glutathione S-transferase